MKPFLLLLVLFPVVAFSQVNEHFNDGNFTSNPSWSGTTGKFIVNTQKQLQLYDSIAGKAWLSTVFHMLPKTEWQFWVKAGFSPSSKNFIRIFLASDTPDVTQMKKGYYLQLGEAGSNDALVLVRKSGDSTVSVCRGSEGLLSGAFEIRVKVLRDKTGDWQLFVDSSGGENFHKEAEGHDDCCSTSSFFGLYCQYTRSNAKKIFFDDIYAGFPQVDTLAPVTDSVAVTSDSTLTLFFNESVDSLSATSKADYQLLPAAGKILNIILSPEKKDIMLTFSEHFKRNQGYEISISGITDRVGNRMKKQTISFVYVNPQPNDVVFNEIMADPTPVVGLPDFEYLELFNRSAADIDMEGWKLMLGKTTRTFGKVVIASGGFLILCKEEAREAFSAYGKTLVFKSFSLTNGGEELELLDTKGQLITKVQYDKSWYGNGAKAEGGWSLEQINPENICSGGDNWKAADNSVGGTPGKQNSVYNTMINLPGISTLHVLNDHALELSFSQKMDSNLLVNTEFYTVSPGVGQIKNISVSSDHKHIVQEMDGVFDTATIYELTVSGSIQNCMGTTMGHDTTLRFGLPQSVKNRDVVINEVLFYPLTEGVDYVELYNRSQKTIDLSSLILGTVKNSPPNPPDTLFYPLTFTQTLLFPGDFMVLTSSPGKVKAQYATKNPKAFLRMMPFPAYNKDAGSVLLFSKLHKIDAFDYTEKMQYPLLRYTQGVALERISVNGKTNNPDNWHSAAESAGFGTPGYRNSQSVSVNPDSIRGEIDIDPEIFSPDNDGYQDILHIKYKFKTSGNTMTINIFSTSGQLVRKLVNNAYVGTDGVVLWNGLKDDGTKALVGIYVFYIRVFDQNGKVMQFKKTAVLAAKL